MRTSTIKNKIQIAMALVFMVVYGFGIIGNPVHLMNHADEQELVCSQPENACHLNLIHADKVNGCDHESHLIEDKSLQCDLCAIAAGSKIAILDKRVQSETPETTDSQISKYTVNRIERISKSVDNRGPPFYS